MAEKKLTEFLNHLNRLHNKIQFTIENEGGGHLAFLDMDIYRKMDGSLGHKIYRKPTHTSLCLHQNSHHHPANKQSVLASLIHRAKALCDEDSLTQELEFLATVFKDNGHSPQQIWRAMEPATRTAKTIHKPTSTAHIPYTQTTYGQLSRMLAKHNIISVALPPRKISSYFPPVKDALGFKNTGCIQHPMWMWRGLYWAKRTIHPIPNQRAQ